MIVEVVMIIVTGGAGFIGSNIVKGLNQMGIRDIWVVDDLTDGTKFKHMVNVDIHDYYDKDVFLQLIQKNALLVEDVDAIFHLGACSTTTEWDGQFMMKNNYDYTRECLDFAQRHDIPFIYASSAAVYGGGKVFKENRAYEHPLNVYGFSKWFFDQYVRREVFHQQHNVIGLRYFNVYGPNEDHKGSMSSVAYHHHQQIQKENKVKLFAGCDGYADGEQRRDFVYVGDVVKVNLWFYEQFKQGRRMNGIFNVGSGRAQSFNEVAKAVIAWHGHGEIEYIPFPEHLVGRYQSFTEADISALRNVGYTAPFLNVQDGVKAYLDQLGEQV
jgi:ADP-L-glycero-D-manno-heptose 6-epimerase